MKDKWTPVYFVDSGQRRIRVEIPDVVCAECPVSLLDRHPGMVELVTEIRSANAVHEATGATLYGTDTAKWPIRWWDAVLMSEYERRSLDRAIDKALREQS